MLLTRLKTKHKFKRTLRLLESFLKMDTNTKTFQRIQSFQNIYDFILNKLLKYI